MAIITTPRPGVKRFIGVDFDFGALRTAGPRYWAFVVMLLIGLGLGGLSWANAMMHGGVVMAMRDSYPWGLWFVNYMYYVGLAAGGLVVYASVQLFGAEQFRPLSRLAVLLAGVFVMMALLGIVTDMERPWRAVWMLMTPNPTSPFIYTGSAANIYMIVCFFDLWLLITHKGGDKWAFRMTLIALPLAIYLHTTTAFVLSMNKSRELWNTAMMVPIFLTSATASGIAVLLIVSYVFRRFGILELSSKMFRSLATLLASVIIIDLFFLLVEILTVFWPTSAKPGHTIRFSQFFTGDYAFAFVPVLVLGITAFALLAGRKTRHLPAIQITASALYIVAVFMKRYSLMSMGFAVDPLGQHQMPYAPSLTEVGLMIGILSLGALMVTVAAKVLPMVEVHHGPDVEHGPAEELVAAEEPPPASTELVPDPALGSG